MIVSGAPPRTEPQIRAGILLPQDGYISIRMKIAAADGYFCQGRHERIALGGTGQVLEFSLSSGGVRLEVTGGGRFESSDWKLVCPPLSETAVPRSGVAVDDVIAGRSFHWKKKIQNILPGALEVSVRDGNLMLINELPLEIYLACVATSEMGAACPAALLEAQTITARSWILANAEQKHRALGCDVCNDDCCQRYQGTTHLTGQSALAASRTRGIVMTQNGTICDARYSKSCGGMTEAFENIWEGPPHDCLRVQPDWIIEDGAELPDLRRESEFRSWAEAQPPAFCSPAAVPEETLSRYLGSVDEDGRYFRWTRVLDQKTLTDRLNRELHLNARHILALEPLQRGGSGRIITLKIVFRSKEDLEVRSTVLSSEFSIRQMLDSTFLYSSAFSVAADTARVPESFTLHGAGWGHGAGLCQIGALGMALRGYDSRAILNHYFPGTCQEKLY